MKVYHCAPSRLRKVIAERGLKAGAALPSGIYVWTTLTCAMQGRLPGEDIWQITLPDAFPLEEDWMSSRREVSKLVPLDYISPGRLSLVAR